MRPAGLFVVRGDGIAQRDFVMLDGAREGHQVGLQCLDGVFVAVDAVDDHQVKVGRPENQVNPLATEQPQVAQALVHVGRNVAIGHGSEKGVAANHGLDFQHAVVIDQTVRAEAKHRIVRQIEPSFIYHVPRARFVHGAGERLLLGASTHGCVLELGRRAASDALAGNVHGIPEARLRRLAALEFVACVF